MGGVEMINAAPWLTIPVAWPAFSLRLFVVGVQGFGFR